MPKRPLRPCHHSGCRILCENRYCPAHEEQHRFEYDKSRGTASERGYNYRWQKARARYLAGHPLCVYCLKDGHVTPATVVDHKIAHNGSAYLMWDENNWQALCTSCHNSRKQSEEKRPRPENLSR